MNTLYTGIKQNEHKHRTQASNRMNTLYTGIKQNKHKHCTQASNRMNTNTLHRHTTKWAQAQMRMKLIYETGYVKIVHIMKFTLFSLSRARTHTHTHMELNVDIVGAPWQVSWLTCWWVIQWWGFNCWWRQLRGTLVFRAEDQLLHM